MNAIARAKQDQQQGTTRTKDRLAELVDRARSEGVDLTGDNGLLTALVRQVRDCSNEGETHELEWQDRSGDQVRRMVGLPLPAVAPA